MLMMSYGVIPNCVDAYRAPAVGLFLDFLDSVFIVKVYGFSAQLLYFFESLAGQ
jgi:hypothetical protein